MSEIDLDKYMHVDDDLNIDGKMSAMSKDAMHKALGITDDKVLKVTPVKDVADVIVTSNKTSVESAKKKSLLKEDKEKVKNTELSADSLVSSLAIELVNSLHEKKNFHGFTSEQLDIIINYILNKIEEN